MGEIGTRHGIADDDHDRPGQLVAMLKRRQIGKRAVQHAAVGAPGIFDHGDGGFGGHADLHQPSRDGCRNRTTHIDRDGRAGDGKASPVRQDIALEVVAGGEDERGRDAAQRRRQLEVGRRRKRRGHARNDLVGNAGLAQRRHFLTRPAEDERIAGL